MTPISSRVSVPFRLGPVAFLTGAVVWLAYRLTQSDGWVHWVDEHWVAEHWVPMLLLAMLAALHRFTVWHLADEVMDCGDHLSVRRERRVMQIPLSESEDVREGRCLICSHSGLIEGLFGPRREVILQRSRASDRERTIYFVAVHSRLRFTHKRVRLVHHLQLRIERAKAGARPVAQRVEGHASPSAPPSASQSPDRPRSRRHP
jgi:hypothetical protein